VVPFDSAYTPVQKAFPRIDDPMAFPDKKRVLVGAVLAQKALNYLVMVYFLVRLKEKRWWEEPPV